MLSVRNLSVQAGSFSIQNISFEIPTGTCVSLMGSSGSGKTTLMEALCGLRHITSGTVHLDDRDITHLRPGEREVALVPQDNALFPHLTVREHLAFGPTIQGWKKADIAKRADELAEQLGITSLLSRTPENLSGGEAKRIALGRAIATRPSLLCLDEALTGLDDETYSDILTLLQSTISKGKLTTLHITHNRVEANQLADTVIEL
jgi:molybdate/tungstate transport system ATP-binding protein